MAINENNYVDITSGLGAGAVATTRTLVGRLFTANAKVPPQSFISFSTAAAVGLYFGTSSEEYFRALFYFSFTSKALEQPQSIQFARWVNAAVAPEIFGSSNSNPSVSTWTSVSAGTFGLTIGGVVSNFSVDFTDPLVTSLADVAAAVQAEIRTGSGSQLTAATVTYNPTSGGFNFVGGATGAATITVQPGIGGTDISGSGFLGWLPQQVNVNGSVAPVNGAVWANGSAIETITQCLTTSAAASNNFGSFLFLNNLNLLIAQIHEAAVWNFAENVKYLYTVPVSTANVGAYTATTGNGIGAIGGVALTISYLSIQQVGVVTSSSAVISNLTDTSVLSVGMPVSGTGIPVGAYILTINSLTSITLSAVATGSATELLTFTLLEFPEQLPMMIEAATNYNRANAVQNYMFQQALLTPSVNIDAQAAAYDALNVNYYGQTQQAGTLISFYQRGLLQGQSIVTNITDMTPYVNEIWLKDANTVALMNLLLSATQIAANPSGRSQVLSVLQQTINLALLNGTISVGKVLTASQKSFITSETNDDQAWYQVQNAGYWLDCVIELIPTTTQYQANYTLIYSKDDVIRKVVGTQTLI